MLVVSPGYYHWREGSRAEKHMNHPQAMAKLQEAVKLKSGNAYKEFAELQNTLAGDCTLRGQLQLKSHENEIQPIPLSQVLAMLGNLRKLI